MVSNRCKMVVKEELQKLGIHFLFVDLGEIDILETIVGVQLQQLKTGLLSAGLELIDNKNDILIEKIKKASSKWFIIQMSCLQ